MHLSLFTTFYPPIFWFAHPIFLTSLRQWLRIAWSEVVAKNFVQRRPTQQYPVPIEWPATLGQNHTLIKHTHTHKHSLSPRFI